MTTKTRDRAGASTRKALSLGTVTVNDGRITSGYITKSDYGNSFLPNVDGRSLVARRYRDIASAIVIDQGDSKAMASGFSEEQLHEVCDAAWHFLASGEPWCFGTIKGAAELAIYEVYHEHEPTKYERH
ncbi:MAG: hypothetical protein ACLQF4_08490 [Xanthobacteraceae bacterium]